MRLTTPQGQEKSKSSLRLNPENNPEQSSETNDLPWDFEKELQWFLTLLRFRIKTIGQPQNDGALDLLNRMPMAKTIGGSYADVLEGNSASVADRLLLFVTLLPRLSPEVLNEVLIDKDHRYMLHYPQFGGYIDKHYLKYKPTLQTVLYLLSGKDQRLFLRTFRYFRDQSTLIKNQIVHVEAAGLNDDSGDILTHSIKISDEYFHNLVTGEPPVPTFGSEFPASKISTLLTWNELILPVNVQKKVRRLVKWIKHKDVLFESTDGKVSPGFPVLFYGPSGTGKTLTAKLLGKELEQPVFRVDLSMVVSKYIGETEKALSRLFSKAEGRNWILFFDEADVLFGKRTDISNANDKYANMEVAYLLQRIEEFDGLVILASNLKDNMDKALIRRFQVMVEFPRPTEQEQLKLWKSLLPSGYTYATDIQLAKYITYNLTGGNVSNIIKHACLECIDKGIAILDHDLVHSLIREELEKTSRTI